MYVAIVGFVKSFMVRALPALACVLVMFAPTVACADFTALSSSNQISGTVFTFDDLPVGFVDGNQAATDAITQPSGFTFSNPFGEFVASSFDDAGHVIDIMGAQQGFDGGIRFRFEDLVGAAGIDYSIGRGTPLSLIAFDDAGNAINPEGSISALVGTTGFFGIASDVGIRELWVHDTAGSFELNNLRFGIVNAPVPGALAMGAFGMVFVVLWRRRT